MNGNIIYHDGTILKGYCNNFKKLYANQLYYLIDFILKYRHETDETDYGLKWTDISIIMNLQMKQSLF